jgi:hypothetical protein
MLCEVDWGRRKREQETIQKEKETEGCSIMK